MSNKRRIKRDYERGFHRLFFTGSGELDLSWFLVLVCTFLACFGFTAEVVKAGQPTVAAWSFLGGAFIAVLIAAVPINKARIIANAKSIGSLSNAIASAGGSVWDDDERADPDWDTTVDRIEITPGARKKATDS